MIVIFRRLLIYEVQPYVLELKHNITEPSRKPSRSALMLGHLRGQGRSSGGGASSSESPIVFHCIVDCCANKANDIIVLEQDKLLVLSPKGELLQSLSDPFPTGLSSYATSLAVDFRSGAIVCCPASRQLWMFDANASRCRYRRTLVDMATTDDVIGVSGRPLGVAVDTIQRRLFVAVNVGSQKTEIRIFQL